MRHITTFNNRLRQKPLEPKRADEAEFQTSPRTDLAVEAQEMASRESKSIKGLDATNEDYEGGIHVSRMHVKTKEAERAIGKMRGHYVTIEVPGLRHRDPELQGKVVERLADELTKFIQIPENGSVLVVGLGNAHVTPDALGPMVVDHLFVTRHLFRYMPEVLDDGFRTVSAVAPGVLGITGIETTEIVRGIVEHVKPDVVIAVDALAARSLNRVNSTIQIADTGVQPGSGVGNKRKALDQSTLGVPCVAIGVPTVVDAATIANDAIDLVLQQIKDHVPGNRATEIFDQFTTHEKWQMIHELLEPIGNNLMVTPKEIDEFVEDIANVVAKGLNIALHPTMTVEDANEFTH